LGQKINPFHFFSFSLHLVFSPIPPGNDNTLVSTSSFNFRFFDVFHKFPLLEDKSLYLEYKTFVFISQEGKEKVPSEDAMDSCRFSFLQG